MKKQNYLLTTVTFFFMSLLIMQDALSQNVGINEPNPTNTLHIRPLNPGDEPLRIEGVTMVNAGDSALLIHNPATGIVRYITMNNLSDSLVTNIFQNDIFLDSIVNIIYDYGDTLLFNQDFITNIQDSVDTHLDSLTLSNTVLSGWVDGDNYDVDLNSLTGVDTSDVVNIIYNFGDTLLYNQDFINNLQDSIDTYLDSLTLNAGILTGWVDGNPNTVDLSILTGTDNQDLTGANLSGNTLTIDIQNGASTSVDLSSLIGTDNQDLTGATLSGNTLTIDIENGASTSVDLSSLIGTDDQNLTGATLSGNILTIDIQNGASTSVNLSSLIGTDSQTLSLSGDDLSISNGNTVNLSSLEDHDWYVANTTTQATSIGQGIFTNGPVGMGTNNPLSALHLSGTALQLRMENTFATGNTFALNSTNAGDFRLLNFAGGTTIPLTVLGANDFVGIGTTIPSQKLHIFDGAGYISNSTGLQSTVLSADGGIELFRDPTSPISPNTSGYVDFKDVESDDYDFRILYDNNIGTNGALDFQSTTDGTSTTTLPRMTILNSNGFVGIGTQSPTQRLEVNGGITMDNGTPDGPRFIWTGGAGLEYRARLQASGHLGFFPVETGNPGYVGEALVMTQDGKVGIADNLAPVYGLEMQNIFGLMGQGRANAWVTYSDARVKSQRKEISNALEVIGKLNPLHYFHHDARKNEDGIRILDSGGFTYGFLAQELYEEIPEIVHKPIDEEKDLWSVDYDKLIPIMTKAIQEQQAIIDYQSNELEEVKEEMENMKAELDAIKKALNK
jgi:hypothetical protein